MGMSSVIVLAKIVAKEGMRAELIAVLQDLVANAHNEPGTNVYAMHTANDDDVTVWFYERYVDQAALATHGTSDTMKAVGPRLAPLMAGRPELIHLTDVAAKGF
jgi:quinol monooxygenase YgiN